MSRIHDALKRAEQERATSMGTHVEPAYNQPEEQRENMPSLQPMMATPPTMTSGLSYESLVARCPQTEWSPDPRTMLFFQEDDTRVGAEEHRRNGTQRRLDMDEHDCRQRDRLDGRR